MLIKKVSNISLKKLTAHFIIAMGLLFSTQNLVSAEDFTVNLTVNCESTEPSISPVLNNISSSEHVSASGSTLTVNVAVGETATIAIDPDAQQGSDCEGMPIPADLTLTYGGELAASPFITDNCGLCDPSTTPVSVWIEPTFSVEAGDYTGTITLAIVTSP